MELGDEELELEREDEEFEPKLEELVECREPELSDKELELGREVEEFELELEELVDRAPEL